MASSVPWWRPDRFERRIDTLHRRGRIKRGIRDHFLAAGFLEVETPILQISPGNETHISAFATEAVFPDETRQRYFLNSSPEFACKKLLAAGVTRLFTLAPVFRNRESGRLHHPEFHMLEWYRAERPLETLVEDCTALLQLAATAAGTTQLRFDDAEADPFAPPELLTVTDAFRRHAGVDLDRLLPDVPDGLERFADAARDVGLRVAEDDTWSDLFSKILSARIEPKLGLGRPTFLTRYPASEAALARLCRDDPRFAERFELYCCGVEVANAFEELTDAAEQRRRFEVAEAERARIYCETHPIDEDFIDALARMPPAVGVALGFDRLVMLATGSARIEDVLWAPVAWFTS